MEQSLNNAEYKSVVKMKSVITALCFPVALFLSSCHSKSAHVSQHQYLYYPDKNVYYDVAQNEYFYSVNGAKTWHTIHNPLPAPPSYLGQGITLFSDSTAVYADNETHRRLYVGVLYNIVKNDSATVVASEITERKIPKKQPTIVTQIETKTKRGLGKLLDKIFGKKEKK